MDVLELLRDKLEEIVLESLLHPENGCSELAEEALKLAEEALEKVAQ